MILPVWGKPALAAVALLAAFSAGFKVEAWRCAAQQTKALKAAQIAFERQLTKQNDEAAGHEQEREQSREASVERQETIRTVFRTVTVPAECAAPDAVRGVLDNAVREANSRAGGKPGATVPTDS